MRINEILTFKIAIHTMDFDDPYGLEDWEDDKILFEKEDWINLLKLREGRAKKNPSDLYAQQRFAEALNLNKRFADTLDFITPLYQDNYEVGFGIHEIIDALHGLGKSENDFDWIVKPKIIKLDSDALKLCVDFLKPKRKPSSITDIYCDLIMHGDYSGFNEEQLGEFLLKNTDTFDIKSDSEYLWDIKIKLKRK
ncbi:hypothetical protein ES703_81713 [subsurface metagenome]